MSNSNFKLSIKAGGRLFINGAVLRFNRKVGIELMNDAVFLLDTHLVTPEQATTPLKRLYFVIQSMLMDPSYEQLGRILFYEHMARLRVEVSHKQVLASLHEIEALFEAGRVFECLKRLRALFVIEAAILALACASPTASAAAPKSDCRLSLVGGVAPVLE
jgi:flagellar biosynthesis repressor protein FlbT